MPKKFSKRRFSKKKPRSRAIREDGVESHLELAFHDYWKPRFEGVLVPQYIFHPVRQWRFDFAIPEVLVAVEIQGYGSTHTSRQGMANDYLKHNEALRLGWGIVYLMGKDLLPDKIHSTCTMIKSIIETRQSTTFLQAMREINVRSRERVPETNTNWQSKIDGVRRKLIEGTD